MTKTANEIKALDDALRSSETARRAFLRDQFAMAAIPGLVHVGLDPEDLAEDAYKIAEAMLKARSTKDNE